MKLLKILLLSCIALPLGVVDVDGKSRSSSYRSSYKSKTTRSYYKPPKTYRTLSRATKTPRKKYHKPHSAWFLDAGEEQPDCDEDDHPLEYDCIAYGKTPGDDKDPDVETGSFWDWMFGK